MQKSKTCFVSVVELLVMELRQLEYFVTVVEESSFTRAANRLHVTQPGVSAQIRQLERELGHELLDRSGRTVRVTQAGAAVLAHARVALSAVDGARTAVDELAGLVRGRVAVGMVTACGALDVAEVLAGFHERYPGIEITLGEANSDELVEALRGGQLDLAWIGWAGDAPAGIASQVLIDEPLVGAVASSDRLAARAGIRLVELRDRPLLCLPRGTGVRSALEAACAAAGFTPQVTFEANSPAMVAQLAGQGLGLAVLPASVAASYPDELHPLPVRRPNSRGESSPEQRSRGRGLRSRVELAWRAEGPVSAAARVLISHARAALARAA